MEQGHCNDDTNGLSMNSDTVPQQQQQQQQPQQQFQYADSHDTTTPHDTSASIPPPPPPPPPPPFTHTPPPPPPPQQTPTTTPSPTHQKINSSGGGSISIRKSHRHSPLIHSHSPQHVKKLSDIPEDDITTGISTDDNMDLPRRKSLTSSHKNSPSPFLITTARSKKATSPRLTFGKGRGQGRGRGHGVIRGEYYGSLDDGMQYQHQQQQDYGEQKQQLQNENDQSSSTPLTPSSHHRKHHHRKHNHHSSRHLARQQAISRSLSIFTGVEQSTSYRDVKFAILFWIQFTIMIGLGYFYGPTVSSSFYNSSASSSTTTTMIQKTEDKGVVVEDENNNHHHYSTQQRLLYVTSQQVIKLAFGGGIIAIFLSTLTLHFTIQFTSKFIYGAFGLAMFTSILIAVCTFSLPPPSSSIEIDTTTMVTFLPIACLGTCGLVTAYGFVVWDRIILFTAILKIAMKAVKETCCGLVPVTFTMQIVGLIWSCVCMFSFVGVYDSLIEKRRHYEEGGDGDGSSQWTGWWLCFVVLSTSYFWTCQLLLYVVQVTVAGVVKEWWFHGGTATKNTFTKKKSLSTCFYNNGSYVSLEDEDNVDSNNNNNNNDITTTQINQNQDDDNYHQRINEQQQQTLQSVVLKSFIRASFYSFGSICFGSLLVTFVRTIRRLPKYMFVNPSDVRSRRVVTTTTAQVDTSGNSSNRSGSSCRCCCVKLGDDDSSCSDEDEGEGEGERVMRRQSSSSNRGTVTAINRSTGFNETMVSCMDRLGSKFNRFAFVNVGMYGYNFVEAGERATALLRKRGWKKIVTDNLISDVLLLLTLVIGGISGLATVGMESFSSSHSVGSLSADATVTTTTGTSTTEIYYKLTSMDHPTWTAFLIGFTMGIVLSSILFGIISSSVNAVILLFAGNPVEFELNHPELSSKMRAAWGEVFPGAVDFVQDEATATTNTTVNAGMPIT